MDHNLSQLIASTSNARMRIRLLAISHFADGKNRTEIANFLKVSCASVNKWVTQYLNDCLEGLIEKPHPGRPSLLSEIQLIPTYKNNKPVIFNRLSGKTLKKE